MADEQLIQIVNKHKAKIVRKFIQAAKKRGWKGTSEVKEVDIFDEVMCKIQDAGFMDDLVSGIEDSIGMEEYGFIEVGGE